MGLLRILLREVLLLLLGQVLLLLLSNILLLLILLGQVLLLRKILQLLLRNILLLLRKILLLLRKILLLLRQILLLLRQIPLLLGQILRQVGLCQPGCQCQGGVGVPGPGLVLLHCGGPAREVGGGDVAVSPAAIGQEVGLGLRGRDGVAGGQGGQQQQGQGEQLEGGRRKKRSYKLNIFFPMYGIVEMF